jgi:chromosome partitioning protein
VLFVYHLFVNFVQARMKVIVLASQKGGSAKTTLTASLAVAAELADNSPAVLIDSDPQGSLASWWNVREGDSPALAPTTLAELPTKLKALEEAGYAFAFVDTPPAITEAIRAVVKTADFVLIPVKPSPHDLRSVGSTVEIVQQEGKPFAFAVTQAKANALLTVQAMAALSAHGRVAPTVMRDRVDYAVSMPDGRTVQETDPRGRSAAEAANLWEFVLDRLHESTKARKHDKQKLHEPAALSAGLVAVKGAAAPFTICRRAVLSFRLPRRSKKADCSRSIFEFRRSSGGSSRPTPPRTTLS